MSSEQCVSRAIQETLKRRFHSSQQPPSSSPPDNCCCFCFECRVMSLCHLRFISSCPTFKRRRKSQTSRSHFLPTEEFWTNCTVDEENSCLVSERRISSWKRQYLRIHRTPQINWKNFLLGFLFCYPWILSPVNSCCSSGRTKRSM